MREGGRKSEKGREGGGKGDREGGRRGGGGVSGTSPATPSSFYFLVFYPLLL